MFTQRIYFATYLVALFAMLLLMGLRLSHSISFDIPLQFITSGDEQSSLFSIWKYANGFTVFVDPTRSPYSMSFFNVLFYFSYGEWLSFWQAQLGLSDAWLPTITRTFTLLGILTGWALLTITLRSISQEFDSRCDSLPGPVALLCAAVIFIGPLMGFWAFTVRPDGWAFVFEVFGVLILIKTYGRNKNLAVTLTATAFFIGWMFKQSAISAVCGVGLFLLFEREWRVLLLYCFVFLGLCFSVIFGGDDVYRQSLFFSKIDLVYSPMHALKVWANAAAKTLPICLPLLIGIYALVRDAGFRKRFLSKWICRFFLFGLIASGSVILVLSLQDGSAENYTFAPIMFAAGFLLSSLLCMPESPVLLKVLRRTWVGAATLHVVLCLLVVTGFTGVVDAASKNNSTLVSTAKCINKLQKPFFVQDTYLSLPWMTESAEPFVLSFLYDRARKNNIPLQQGGIGGRIQAGGFATLVLSTNMRGDGYDGANLKNYRLQPTSCGHLYIWSRIEP